MKVRLDFIGCRLNISEMESLGRQFRQAGHQVVGPGEEADLCVFNTCAVTGRAAQTSRQRIRHLRRENPAAGIVVTGCYAELEPQQVQALGADLVVSNADKDALLNRTIDAGLLDEPDSLPAPDATFPLPDTGRTRAFIKVQDGCDNRCTFCIVTVARGAGRSRQIADVVAEVQELQQHGYQEAVLSGVHLGSFGHDYGDSCGLYHLVQAILQDTDISRLRLSSLEPWDLAASFFELWADPRLGRHLHLPLQSGSDEILKRMARRTSQTEFRALVQAARQAIPGVSITTDLIVGFPGETETHFAESLAFVDEMAFSDMHIFRYSARSGTAAARMPGQVRKKVAQERSRQMHDCAARHARAFRQQMIGQTVPVLWESVEDTFGGRLWHGLSDNYIRVAAFSRRDLHNQITPVHLTALLPDAVSGEIPGETIPLQMAVSV